MVNKDSVRFNVLEAISVVANKLSDSKLRIKKTQEFSKAQERLDSYFKTKSSATWILCGIISHYFDNESDGCNFNKLSNFFCVPVMKVVSYTSDIETLLKKGYITNTVGLDSEEVGIQNCFELSSEFLQSIISNKKISITKKNEGEELLFSTIKKMGRLIDNPFAPNSDKTLQIKDMETKLSNNAFFSTVIKLVPDFHDRMFFYDCCSDLLDGHESHLSTTLDNVYAYNKFILADDFLNESHILLKTDLIEFTQKGNLMDSEVQPTAKAKEMLLGENAKLFTKSAKGTEIIQPQSIKQKALFYARENEAEINRLKSSLHEENLRPIQKRLLEKGLPQGIAVLLYGAPGTGKTESVYQIAKETGRQILHVDISSAKSCWFGESEKNIKKVFTDYRSLCKTAKSDKNGKMPILLFNEADAILSKRKDSASGNVVQTENAMQNIILEEMEKLEGIMICTTNLATNLDAAFERRFLFKIKFENPTVEAKQKIWKSKLDWLNDDMILSVAQNYDLSGGQIDNIVRKITMDEILTGKRPDLNELDQLCKHERLGGAEKRIGFF
ncbi:MAG: ATP-binding protein [Treponema sp.]|nr:ATP-binding protein [Treponema sp.]